MSMAATPQAVRPDGEPSPGLVLNGIGVHFGGLVALDDVSMHVEANSVVGVVGPNGAGKTTLFNVVCGFVRPRTGSMSWEGAALRPRPHRLASLGIARTLQGLGLFAGLSVVENVMVGANPLSRAGVGSAALRAGFGSALLALPAADRDERALRRTAMDCLDELGVAGYAGHRPDSLPHPVRKRVALARALVARPRLLLLDEPAGGLGGQDIDELAALVRALPTRPSGGCAVVLVEHHMDLVMRVCEQVVVLDFGRVIAAGTPAEISDDAAVADAYLGAEVADGIEEPA
jgi:branched-chain amino acid transport system ATP-binding protein